MKSNKYLPSSTVLSQLLCPVHRCVLIPSLKEEEEEVKKRGSASERERERSLRPSFSRITIIARLATSRRGAFKNMRKLSQRGHTCISGNEK